MLSPLLYFGIPNLMETLQPQMMYPVLNKLKFISWYEHRTVSWIATCTVVLCRTCLSYSPRPRAFQATNLLHSTPTHFPHCPWSIRPHVPTVHSCTVVEWWKQPHVIISETSAFWTFNGIKRRFIIYFAPLKGDQHALSNVSLLSGITGLLFDFLSLSPLLFFGKFLLISNRQV